MSWQIQAKQSEIALRAFIQERYIESLRKVMGIKLATLWYRRSKDGWDFNHLEDGHCQNNHPTPKHPIHNQVWKGRGWAKAHVQLNGTANIVGYFLILN
jgi:hypothetical protein